MQDWTRIVPVGGRGRLLLQLANALPIVQLQVKVGQQVIAEIDGAELRDLAGLYFSVARQTGLYNFTVAAKDSSGCTTETTALRSFTVS